MTGISYDGLDKSGGVNWYGLANVHLLNHETGLTLQVREDVVMFVIQVEATLPLRFLTSKRAIYSLECRGTSVILKIWLLF